MDNFLIERLMGIFWVIVQQFCFVCVKYAHDDIAKGDGRVVRLAVSQCAAAIALSAFCFERELGAGLVSGPLSAGEYDYFPWTVRIVICGAMILFDSLLVLYFARIVRLYTGGLDAARSTLPGDLAVCLLISALCFGYIRLSVSAAVRYGFDMCQYMWVGRFFIQISNFFYIALEIGGAILMWSFFKRIRRGADAG